LSGFWRFAQDLPLDVLLSLFILASVVLTWNHPLVTTALLIVALALQALFRPVPGDRIVMVVAALLGTAGEIAEVRLGEWTYHAPDLVMGVPMWIALIWANLFALFGRLVRSWSALLDLWPGTATVARARARLFLAIPVITLWVAALILMKKILLVWGIYLLMILIMALYWRTEKDLLLFLTGAILGAMGEFISVQLGYWSYYNPLFTEYGVDITLPLDWGLSAVIIHRVGNFLDRRLRKSV
jgi:uncharacterized membrane protein YoaT (DUF817 family)